MCNRFLYVKLPFFYLLCALELAFEIAICLWLLALNSNKTFFWSSDFVPGLPIPFASPAAASKAQVLFLFDQMIDLDL